MQHCCAIKEQRSDRTPVRLVLYQNTWSGQGDVLQQYTCLVLILCTLTKQHINRRPDPKISCLTRAAMSRPEALHRHMQLHLQVDDSSSIPMPSRGSDVQHTYRTTGGHQTPALSFK